MSRTRSRWWWRALAALAVVGVLTGCVRIPDSGGVSTVAIPDEGDTEALLPVPEGPTVGATPREILIGFLRAGRGPQNSYAVATEYLTDAFAAEWRPNAGVLVSTSAVVPTETETGLQVSLEVTAEVDSSGHYDLAGAGSSRQLSFEFTQEDGEWRISAAPDGTGLSPTFFELLFEPVELYYFSPDFEFLVPELRWFLVSRTISNRIVDELIAGQSPLLESGVLITAVPNGLERLESVDIESGTATVTLSSDILAVSSATQWRILQQLTASLGSLSDVHSAAVISGGFPADISEVGGTADRFLQVDPIPVGMLAGEFGSIGESEVRPLDEIGTAIDALGATAASVSRDRSTVAVLTAEGVSRVTADGVELAAAGTDLIAPTIDPWGYIWTGPEDQLEQLFAVSPDGTPLSIGIGIEGRVIDVSVSRDGTRVVFAVATDDGSRLVVAGIVRDASGAPIAIVESTLVSIGAGELLDVSWVDGTTIALLLRSGQSTTVSTATLGGRLESLGALENGEQIVGGNGVEGIRVLDSDGVVHRPSGDSSWLDTGLRASFLATQQ